LQQHPVKTQCEQPESVRKSHWENIYSTKGAMQVSWYAPHLQASLKLIEQTGISKMGQIIDVGGGASTLVDDLLENGYENISVLDIASKAMQISRMRLGEKAAAVTWLEADITQAELPADYFDLWHDRAVFHFLACAEERQRYVEIATRSLKSGGFLIIAPFAPDAPPRCSGLEVRRYSQEDLQSELGEAFELVDCTSDQHLTPFHTEQHFLYCCFRKQ
jgi:ubiquinone/menaquinone biosynthesis C-methylase UbiE